MRSLFLAVSVLGFLYFLLKKRHFDFYTISFFSALIYFSPGFIGIAGYSPNLKDVYYTIISPTAYTIYFIFLFLIILSATIHDSCRREVKSIDLQDHIRIKNEPIRGILFFICIISFATLLGKIGDIIFSEDKEALLKSIGREYILFSTTVPMYLVSCVLGPRTKHIYVAIGLVLFSLYIGFRDTAAMSVLSLTVVLLWPTRARLITRWKAILAISFAVIFLLYIKQIQYAIKSSDTALLFDIIKDPNFLLIGIIKSEPFLTQAILTDVINYNINIDPSELLSLLSLLIPFSPELGLPQFDYNAIFQPQLYPEIEWGVASNIFAMFYSFGGLPFVFAFCLVFSVLPAIFNKLLVTRKTTLIVAGVPAAVYIFFFIHRNDLVGILTISKRFFMIWIILEILLLASNRRVHRGRLSTRPAP